MALNIPKTVQALITDDNAVTRGFSNVKSAVDPLLALCNSTFAVAQDGSLAFLRTIKNFAATNITGTTVGATTVNATTVGAPTGGALTVNATTTNTTGTATAASNVSASGFKSMVDMGYYWNSSAAASTRYRTVFFSQNSAASSNFQVPTLMQIPFSGSIVGIHAWNQGSVGGNCYVEIFKNTLAITGTPIFDGIIGSAGNNIGSYVTFAKGTYPFVVGDYFITSVAYNTAGNQLTQVRLIVEIGA